jgi:hypothetical protein
MFEPEHVKSQLLHVPKNINTATLLGCIKTCTLRLLKYINRGFLPYTCFRDSQSDISTSYTQFLEEMKIYFYEKILTLEIQDEYNAFDIISGNGVYENNIKYHIENIPEGAPNFYNSSEQEFFKNMRDNLMR